MIVTFAEWTIEYLRVVEWVQGRTIIIRRPESVEEWALGKTIIIEHPVYARECVGEWALGRTIIIRCPENVGEWALGKTIIIKCPENVGEWALGRTIIIRCPERVGEWALREKYFLVAHHLRKSLGASRQFLQQVPKASKFQENQVEFWAHEGDKFAGAPSACERV